MALSDERRRRLEEEQQKAVQNNLRAAAERDAATFDRLERLRAETQRYNQNLALNQAVADYRQQARDRAIRTRQEDIAEMQRVADVTAEQDAYDRNLIDYNRYWRSRQDTLDAAEKAAKWQRSNSERKRDYIRSSSPWTRRVDEAKENLPQGYELGAYNGRTPYDRRATSETQQTAIDRYEAAKSRRDAIAQEAQTQANLADKAIVTDIPNQRTMLEYERRYMTGRTPQEIASGLDEKVGWSALNRGKMIARQVLQEYSEPSKVFGTGANFIINQLGTDEEKAIILRMAENEQWDDIEKYYDALTPTLNERRYNHEATKIADLPESRKEAYSQFGNVAGNLGYAEGKLGQAVYGTVMNMGAPAAYAQILMDTARSKISKANGGPNYYTDLNADAVGNVRLGNFARAESLKNFGETGQLIGNAAYSTIDNLLQMPLGPQGALITMALSSAGQSAIQTLERGGTQGQAVLMGAVNGAIEYLTEKLPIDNFFEVLNTQGKRGLLNALKDWLSVAFPEAAEEYIGSFASTLADRYIMGSQSEYDEYVQKLQKEDKLSYTEAKKQAFKQFFQIQPLNEAAAGAISGAALGGVSVAGQRLNQRGLDLATGRDITDNRQIADLVLDEGMKSTDERVKALSYALDTVRHENRNSEGFQWSKADLREIGEVYDSLDDAAKKRISDDYAERERTRQEEEAERVRAREAEIQAEQDARAREDAQSALAEREAETDRIVEDAEAIDLDNPEALTEEADTTARRGSDEYTDRVETAEDVDADMRRRAAAAEEATRTGDRSALDNLEQPRRTTESTAQTNRQTEQQEPVNHTQQRRDMKKQVREVYSDMGITSEVSVGEIADAMQEAYNAIREKGDGSDSLDERKAFLSTAQEHFEEDMLRQAEEDRDRQFGAEDEVYTQARKTIRGTRLYVPQSLNASELGVDSFNEFRRANFGVLNLTRDSQAMPIDTFYDELVREYPGLFPDPGSEGGPTSEADMLRTIAEVYRSRGSAMQAEPIDTDAINAESKRKAMELYRPMVEAAQQAYTTAQTTARQNAEQAGQTTANNARRAGLSAADSLALSNVARDLGVGLEFRKMKYGRVNGFYNRETNTVVLNQDLSTAEMAWTTFAHEIVHAAESAGNYQQLADIAKRISVKDADKGTEEATWRGTVDELRRVYAQEGFKISRESAEHEAVTNILQDVLGSREALEGVARESKANGRALLSDVDNVLDRTTTNNAAITPEAARLAEAQKALAAALGEVQENARYTASVPGQQVEASISGINMDEIIKTAVEKYGRMKPGVQYTDENGNRITHEETMANAYEDGKRARKGYRTAAEANVSDPILQDIHTQAILDQYTPKTNAETVAAAKAMRNEYDSFDAALQKWNSMMQDGLSWRETAFEEQVAFGTLLYHEALRKEHNGKVAIEILTDLAQFETALGRGTQASNLLKQLGPEGELIRVKRLAQQEEQRLSPKGKKRNVPKDVQTVIEAEAINDELLDRAEQLKKLKDFEKNGGKQAEKVADQIAELEKEIEDLNKKLEPLRKRLAKLNAERAEDAKEVGNLKREEKYRPRQIENAQKQIDEIQKTIKELNEKLNPLRMELISKLEQADLKKAERNKLAKELSKVNEQIRDAKEAIKRAQAGILHTMSLMSVKKMKLNELNDYVRILSSSKEIMNTYLRYTQNKGTVEIPMDLQTAFLKAKTDEEREKIRYQMDVAIADQLPGTWAEKWRTWRYTSMLANFSTHVRNILGNVGQFTVTGVSDTTAAAVEAATMKGNTQAYSAAVERVAKLEQDIKDVAADKNLSREAKESQLKRLNESRAQALQDMETNERRHAVVIPKVDAALYEAATNDYRIIKEDLQAGGKASETQRIEDLRKIYTSWFGEHVLEPIRKKSSMALEKEDAWFLQGNYTRSFAEYLKANGIDPKTMTEAQRNRARAVAFQDALEATYRDASALADKLNDIEKMNPFARFFMAGLMPFKKTPINIAKRGIEYSPVSLIRGSAQLVKIANGTESNRTKSEAIGTFCKGVTGLALVAMGFLLAGAGKIRLLATPGADDKTRDRNMDEATGQQNYAIQFGDSFTYTLDWLVPASIPLFIGARMREVYGAIRDKNFSGAKLADAAIDGMISMLNPVFELTMLDGVTSLLKSYQNEGSSVAASALWSVIESYALQGLPTLGGKLARTIDPYQRSTKAQGGTAALKEIDKLYRKAIAKIPYLSQLVLPTVPDQYGNPKENVGGNIVGRFFYNMISPGYYKKITHYEPDEELKALYAKMQEINPSKATSVLPPEVPTSIAFSGENYYLTAKQMSKYGETSGKQAYSELETLFASDEYRNANTTMQAKMVADIFEEAGESAKREYFEDIGVLDDYLRTKIEPLLYDNSTGETVARNLAEVREIYEQGRLDLKTVEAAAAEIAHTTKTGAKLDLLNSMIKSYNLTQDEYDFLYMTKIANQYMQDDMQAVLDAGGTLDQAINTVARFYKWDANAVDKTTGEAGMWVKYDKGTQAAYLSQSKLSAPAKEAFYLNNIVSTNNVEKEQAKIADYYKRNLSFDDYLQSLGTKYDDEGTAYENNAGLFRELYVSDLSAAVKEAAVYNLARFGGDGADKAQADIDAYKKSGLTVQDYILTKASLYDDEDHAYTKTADKAKGLLESGLSDKALKVAWYTVASDAQGAEDEINAFMKGGNTVKQFLQTKAAASGDNMKSYQKAQAVLKQNLSSYTAAITSIVTSSENQATGIQNCLNAGISDRKVAEGYAKYAEINANDALNATQKATEFSKWLNTDSSMSGLTTAQRDMMRASFVYFMMTPASAGRYDNLMKLDGMTSKAAESISADIAKLEPINGAKQVSTIQRIMAAANNKDATEKQIDQAIIQLLDTSDDGQEASAVASYKTIRNSGISAKVYAQYRTTVSGLSADKDANGKTISGSKKNKVLAAINALPISAKQKDVLYYDNGYAASTINEAPWH